MRTVVLLSDIHSNLIALQAVIADMKELAPDAVFVLGDLVNGCPWPGETLDLLGELGWPMLMGNHDDAVLQLGTSRMEPRYAYRERYGAIWWTREHLSPRHIASLERLPLELAPCWSGMPPVRLVHGTPGNFSVGLRPDSPEDWAARRLASVEEPVVAGGHTHVPMVRRLARWLFVNTGAVCMPYDGDWRASYAWLRADGPATGFPAAWDLGTGQPQRDRPYEGMGTGGEWKAGIRRVAYDVEAVDRAFETSGLLAEGGVMAEMIRRSMLSGLPWISDFVWWMRQQPDDLLADMPAALAHYDSVHGPGHWAFPFV